MKIIKFNKNSHSQALLECLAARGAYQPTSFPKIGFVAVKNNRLVAAVFLRRVEGGFGQIDGLTSNPFASSEDRDLALDLVSQRVLKEAKKLNVNNLIMTSRCENTITRSQKFGFEKSPLAVLVVDLNNRRVD